ncbi:MAG: hypothetical protein HON94_07640 [Methylococcales bacterium]|nr:hypothetical protein [Methylococcales bacterium]MBT7409904.1 hypothetical protein [Methylococcales bacterium]
MTDSDKKVEQCINDVCQLGCQAVNNLLSDEKNIAEISLLNNLTVSEQKMVMDELRGIMSVYKKSNRSLVKKPK